MYVDIGNALASVADPGVTRSELEGIDDQVAAAHSRIAEGREDNEFGYAALNLPDLLDAGSIHRAVEPVADAGTVVTVGIGGSALGARTITTALTDDAGDSHVVLDNVDPDEIEGVLADLSFEDVAVNVVSKSGTTAETLANFLVVREAMDDAGVDWTERTVVTTGQSGPLADLAAEHDLPTLAVPAGVPGRFSALSAVGLVPAAILGCDVEGILDGAAEAWRRSARRCSTARATPTAPFRTRWRPAARPSTRSCPTPSDSNPSLSGSPSCGPRVSARTAAARPRRGRSAPPTSTPSSSSTGPAGGTRW